MAAWVGQHGWVNKETKTKKRVVLEWKKEEEEEEEGRVRGVTCREERIGKYKKKDQRKKRSEWG